MNVLEFSKSLESKQDMFTLTSTTLLNRNCVAKFEGKAKQYKQARTYDWIHKATLTFVNSIITENKAVFVLTRESLRKVLASDKNWTQPLGLANSEYKHFIKHISKRLVSITKHKRLNREVMICTVIYPELLKLIDADITKQTREVKMFVTGEIEMESEVVETVNVEAVNYINSIIDRLLNIKNIENRNKLSSFGVAAKINGIVSRYEGVR